MHRKIPGDNGSEGGGNSIIVISAALRGVVEHDVDYCNKQHCWTSLSERGRVENRVERVFLEYLSTHH